VDLPILNHAAAAKAGAGRRENAQCGCNLVYVNVKGKMDSRGLKNSVWAFSAVFSRGETGSGKKQFCHGEQSVEIQMLKISKFAPKTP
jgi:hypothetical protein